ncbi:MAG: DUF6252 family protein [Thermoflexibacter sp.]|jgi:hypothetical protein|nr:DUF6252 family protein [Thermoflexibacter sp.]
MKHLFILFAISLLLISCKKEEKDFVGMATFKIDNQLKIVNFDAASAFYSNNISIYFIDNQNTVLLNLNLQRKNRNATVFPFECCKDNDRAGAALVIEREPSQETRFTAPDPQNANIQQGSIKISRWTDNEIEGTFDFVAVGQTNANERVSITEGTFYAKRE